jgi:hypothetical protein
LTIYEKKEINQACEIQRKQNNKKRKGRKERIKLKKAIIWSLVLGPRARVPFLKI